MCGNKGKPSVKVKTVFTYQHWPTQCSSQDRTMMIADITWDGQSGFWHGQLCLWGRSKKVRVTKIRLYLQIDWKLIMYFDFQPLQKPIQAARHAGGCWCTFWWSHKLHWTIHPNQGQYKACFSSFLTIIPISDPHSKSGKTSMGDKQHDSCWTLVWGPGENNNKWVIVKILCHFGNWRRFCFLWQSVLQGVWQTREAGPCLES